jgi:hypothetical protein
LLLLLLFFFFFFFFFSFFFFGIYYSISIKTVFELHYTRNSVQNL